MDIDFIKWMCDKAEGFEIKKTDELFMDGECIQTQHDSFRVLNDTPLWRNIYYPLLLQRAIEGVNKVGDISIDQLPTYIYVTEYQNNWAIAACPFLYETYSSLDQAKESVLRYIYEREAK